MIFRFFYTRRRRKKPSGPQVEELRRRARAYLPGRLAFLASRASDISGLEFRYSRVAIKNNLTNWGSCSTKGNINLNLHLMKLPTGLQDYVMLHELCHLVHPDHSPGFHKLLDSLCTAFGLGHEKELRAELRKERIA